MKTEQFTHSNLKKFHNSNEQFLIKFLNSTYKKKCELLDIETSHRPAEQVILIHGLTQIAKKKLQSVVQLRNELFLSGNSYFQRPISRNFHR